MALTVKVNIGGPALPSDVRCPNASALATFEAAVRRGDITWHAFPFNAEPELMTPELFDAALSLTAVRAPARATVRSTAWRSARLTGSRLRRDRRCVSRSLSLPC